MAKNRLAAEQIADEVRATGVEARIRFMIGGWLLYADDVLIGQIQGTTLFMKESAYSKANLPELRRSPPYAGARDAVEIPEPLRDDIERFSQLVEQTRTEFAKSLRQRRRPYR